MRRLVDLGGLEAARINPRHSGFARPPLGDEAQNPSAEEPPVSTSSPSKEALMKRTLHRLTAVILAVGFWKQE